MPVIGVDLGGTNLSVGLVENAAILKKMSCRTDTTDAKRMMNQITAVCRELLAETGKSIVDLSGVGIACPGWVDSKNGIVCSSANLPLSQFFISEQLFEALKVPIKVENDANCAALGEYQYGAGRGYQSLLMLTVGTGLGAGVVLDGKMFTGPGVAELGHTVLMLDGELCGCGRRGCCEAYISATGLVKMAAEAAKKNPMSALGKEKIIGQTVFAAARRKDPAALAVLEQYISCFAEALMNFVNIFRPEAVIIGGGIANADDEFFVPLRQRFERVARANVYGVKTPDILKAELNDAIGILGAAALFEKEG